MNTKPFAISHTPFAALGFTLMEMLMTLTVLAILAGIGAYNFVGAYRQSILKSSANEIVSLAKLAQQKALAQESGTAWGVYVDNTTAADPYASLYSGDTYTVGGAQARYQIPKQINVSVPAIGTSTDVHFQTFSGLPTASTTVVIGLRGSGFTKTITITAAGGISSN